MMTINDVIEQAGVYAMKQIWLAKYIQVLKRQFETSNGHPSSWNQSVIDSIQVGTVAFDPSTYSVFGSIIISGQEFIVARAIVIDEGNQHNGPLMIRPNQEVWNHQFNGRKTNGPVVHVKEFSSYERRKKNNSGDYVVQDDEYTYETVSGHGSRKHSGQSLSSMRASTRSKQLKARQTDSNHRLYNSTGYLAFKTQVPMPSGMNHDGVHVIKNAQTIMQGFSADLMAQTNAHIQNEILNWYKQILGIKG